MQPLTIFGAIGDDPPKANLYYGLNVLDSLRLIPDDSINMACTSPPYWSLRDYGVGQQVWGGDADCPHEWGDEIHGKSQTGGTNPKTSTLGAESWGNGVSDEGIVRSQVRSHVEARISAFCGLCGAWRGCLGLEPTPDLFTEHMVLIGREIRRVLHPTGTFWLNLGDSYMSHAAKDYTNLGGREGERQRDDEGYKSSIVMGRPSKVKGLKDKDLVGVPWRVALALQADGWWLRNDIIWQKCLGASTRLYARTQKGEMPTMLKDLVRLDPSTVELWNGSAWTQAVRWEKVEAKGLEIEFRSGERITCTKEHRWPTQRGLIEADQLVAGDVVSSTTLPDNVTDPSLLPDEDVGWFVGVYLAEGSRGNGGKAIQIAGHINEKERFRRLGCLAGKFHSTCQMHTTSSNGATINLHGPVLHGIIDTYISGKDAHTKHLSMRCWERTNAFLKAVVEGYLHGDGHDDPKNPRFRLGFCRNNNLARDLRTLAARLGATITLKPAFATGFGKRQPIFRGEWRWVRSGHHNEKNRAEIVAIRKAKGRIFYDIEVEDEPHLFATASGLLTHNSNAMPSSVRDRFSCKYEHVFLLTKSKRYFFDLDAVKIPHTYGVYDDDGGFEPAQQWFEDDSDKKLDDGDHLGELAAPPRQKGRGDFNINGKNPGDIWNVATTGYRGAHFAVWPPLLVERFVKAGSSEKGRCPTCKTPWKRVVEKGGGIKPATIKTVGWESGCECETVDIEPCVVLDTFSGSGTTGVVAMRLGRDYVGLDLNPEYLPLAEARLTGRKAPEIDDEPDLIGDLFG